MKKIIITLFLFCQLVFSNDTNTTALDVFLFKIGFNSLVGELENQKELSNENRKLISDLQNKLNNISDINGNMQILTLPKNTSAKENYIISLENKVKNLEDKINTILDKSQEQSKKKTPLEEPLIPKGKYIMAVLIVKNANVFSAKDNNSDVLFTVKKNDLLKIKHCDEFSWCEVYDQKAYLAKYKLKF